jgi:cell surface protein SprA
MNNFEQNANLNWTLPLNKIPILDWVAASAGYQANFRYTKGAKAFPEMGNTIENSRNIRGRVDLDFIKLYNKSKFLKEINTPKRQPAKKPAAQSGKARPGDEKQKEDEKKPAVTGKEVWNFTYKGFLRVLMLVRSVGVEYNMTDATILPGFMGTPNLFGTNFKSGTPGIPFAFGQQTDIREKLVARNMMSKDSMQNAMYQENKMRSLKISALVEPVKDLKIQINAILTSNENNSEFFKYDQTSGEFGHFSPAIGGNYNISIIALRTSFAKNDDAYNNSVYQNFLNFRPVISERLAQGNDNSNGTFIDTLTGDRYHFGYGPTSQEVLITSFIAAYTGQDPKKVKLSAFPRIPLPNWNLSYDFSKFKPVGKVFNRFKIQHSYTSTYSVGSYARNVNFQNDAEGLPTELDLSENFIADKMFGQIVISEQFNPLIKLDVETKNNIQFNAEVKRNRNLGLSFSNNQISEQSSHEYVFGAGYVIKNVGFNVHSGGNKRKIQSDINLRANVSIRNNVTVLRKIDVFTNTPSAGATIITLNFSADYKLTENFTIRLFYDQTMNTPKITSLVYTATSQGGFSLKFNFNQ